MSTAEFITCSIALLVLAASRANSLPSSYLSSMTGGEGGMTWMGWTPQSGMTAFASSANPWTSDKEWKNTGIELEPPPQENKEAEETSQEEKTPPKKWNKPRDDEDNDRPSSSRAEASLNAWFPIMLGLFPPQGENRNEQADQGWDGKSIAAVANSVNHGSRGVASSHAVAFGGQPPTYRSRTWNRSWDKNGQEHNGQPQNKPQQYYKRIQRYANGNH